MPKKAARSRRSIATVTSTAVISASVAVLLLPVTAPPAGAAAAPGTTQRASLVSPGNTEAQRGAQDSVLSGNGQSVAFTSQSRLDPSLDVGSGESVPYSNVFVRDLVRGRSVMISRGQFGTGGGGSSTGTPGGGVHFGPNKVLELQPGGGGTGQDGVPIKDTPPNGNSYSPSISGDGRFVAFSTRMTNMFLNDSDSDSEIVVVDRDPDADGDYDEDGTDSSGKPYRLYQYYKITNTPGSFEYARLPKISADASRIVWVQGEGDDELWTATLNLRNSNAPVIGQATRVPSPTPLNLRLRDQGDPAISGDGNHIVGHLVYDPTCDGCEAPSIHEIVSTDMRNGQSIRVDIDGGKPISNDFLEVVQHPAVSFDGSVIAFVAEQFDAGFEGPIFSKFNEPTTYVVHIAAGKVARTDIVSRDNAFNIINGDRPGLSPDGRYVAFVTDNLRAHDGNDLQTSSSSCIQPPQSVPGLTGKPLLKLNALPPQRNAARTKCQVVVRDLIVDQNRLGNEQPRLPGTLVSGNQAGNAGNDNSVPDRDFSTPPSLSDNGGRIAFDSSATDLATTPPDTNRRTDVYVRTLEPGLAAQPVAFGQVQINTTSTRTAVLTVTGFGPVAIEQITIAGTNPGDFAIGGQTCQNQTIHQTESCEVSIRFTPSALGDRSAVLRVPFRGARQVFTVNLTGTGNPAPLRDPQFAANPSPLNFNGRLLLSEGPTSAVTVTNGGEAALQISAIDIVGPGNPEDFKVASSTCGGQVPGNGGTCVVNVSFSPRGPGNRSAVLRFTDNVPGGPHLVGLQGSANQPTIAVNPGVTPPSRVVNVIGKDFPPGKVVTVKFDGRPGQVTIKSKDDGTFTVGLLVFPKASPETRTVLATVPDFTDPLARAQLLIVFPTVTPANFVVRG